jgi:ATP-dependent DNA ligase
LLPSHPQWARSTLTDLLLDAEAVAHCLAGMPDFHRLLDGEATACLYAFDLLEINGEDLRPLRLSDRKEAARQRPSAGA